MAGADFLVAIGARGRLRGALVRLVATETGLRAVHADRRERALLLRVATLAIRRLVRLHTEQIFTERGFSRAAVDRNARRLVQQCFGTARSL